MHIPFFPGHQPDEEVVMLVHRHRLAFLVPLIAILGMVALPLVIIAAGSLAGFNIFQSEWAVASLGIYGLFVVSISFVLWMDYFYDFIIITDQRIVNVEQEGLLGRRISYVSLLRVQDATSKVRGLFQSLFHYGEVLIETAGSIPDVIQRDTPNPARVVRTVMELHDRLLEKSQRTHEIAHGEGTHRPG